MKNPINRIFLGAFVFIFLLSSGLSQASTGEMTLKEAVRIGLTHNLQILLHRIDNEEKKERSALAQAAGDEDLIQQTKEEKKRTAETLLEAKKQLIQSIEAAYFNILQAEDQLEVKQEALERNSIQLQADEIRYEAGEIATRDIIMSRNNYQELVKSFEEDQEALALRKQEFNHLLGQKLHKHFILVRDVDFEEYQIDPEEAYQLALVHRDDMERGREAIREAEEELERLDNPFHAPVKIQEARNNLLKEKIRLEQLTTSIYFEIQRACQALQKAYERIEQVKGDQRMKELELESLLLQYEAGLISTQKIMEAQAELTRAENRIIQEKWNYNSTQMDLEKTLGLWSIQDYLEGVEFPLRIPDRLDSADGEVEG